jgi:SAM-dependent methyltransferase
MHDHAELFAGTASYYARYRRGYSPDLPEAFAQLCELDGRGRLLDLGTGTGALALALAHLVEAGIAVDSDNAMLSEGSRIAKSRGIDNIQFVHSRAEDLDQTIGTFRLITVGSAFHWMDRARILDFAYDALEPSGVFTLLAGPRAEIDPSESALPPIPWDRVQAVITRYLGAKRRAGRGVYSAPDERYEDLLDGSKFGGHHTLTLPGSPTTRTVDEVIGYLYSTSYASRRLFGERAAAFEAELRQELLGISSTGEFSEAPVRTEIIYSRRA